MNVGRMRWTLLTVMVVVAANLLAAEPPSSGLRAFPQGRFTALEPMANLRDPVKPTARWFHENTLTITGNEVVLKKSPVFFYKGKKGYSVSDGGFYTYRGTVSFAGGHWSMELILTDSDYVRRPVDKEGKAVPPKPQDFTIARIKHDSFVVDTLTYRRFKQE